MPKKSYRLPLSRLLYIRRLILDKADNIQYLRQYGTDVVYPLEIHIPHGEHGNASIWVYRDASKITGWFKNEKRPPFMGFESGGHQPIQYEHVLYYPSLWQRVWLQVLMDSAEQTSECGW